MVIENISRGIAARFANINLADDPELKEIVALAANVTKTPIAAITFIDGETLHLEVRKGVDVSEIPLELSFCTYAVEQNSLMIVNDATLDERFMHNPLVMEGPKLRFFAGMPLIDKSGKKLGTLCVLDVKPGFLDEHQQLVLKVLSAQVMKVIELKEGLAMLNKKQQELEEQRLLNNDANIRLRSFFESSTNFQVLLGKAGEVIDFNKTAFNFVRAVLKAELKRGEQFAKYVHPTFVATFLNQYNLALQGTKSAKEGSTDYEEMGVIWWEAAFEAARDNNNEIIGVSYLIRNVTERKLKEQKIINQNMSLLRIAHIQAHEFRAPLTSIMGLMGLIKAKDYNAPKEYYQMLEQAVNALDDKIKQIVSDVDGSVVDTPLATF